MKRALLVGILLVGITIVLFLKHDKKEGKNENLEENNTYQPPYATPAHSVDTVNDDMIYLIETSL